MDVESLTKDRYQCIMCLKSRSAASAALEHVHTRLEPGARADSLQLHHAELAVPGVVVESHQVLIAHLRAKERRRTGRCGARHEPDTLFVPVLGGRVRRVRREGGGGAGAERRALKIRAAIL